jgi:hypothetical protein
MWRWQQSQRSDDIMMTGGGIIYRWYGASSWSRYYSTAGPRFRRIRRSHIMAPDVITGRCLPVLRPWGLWTWGILLSSSSSCRSVILSFNDGRKLSSSRMAEGEGVWFIQGRQKSGDASSSSSTSSSSSAVAGLWCTGALIFARWAYKVVHS